MASGTAAVSNNKFIMSNHELCYTIKHILLQIYKCNFNQQRFVADGGLVSCMFWNKGSAGWMVATIYTLCLTISRWSIGNVIHGSVIIKRDHERRINIKECMARAIFIFPISSTRQNRLKLIFHFPFKLSDF